MTRIRERSRSRKHRLFINGREVSRDEFLRKRIGGSGVAMGTNTAYSTARPLSSLSMSCHRNQADTYNAEAKKQGLTGIVWDHDGDCTITSRRDRAKWLRSQQQHDADGGYGDG